MESIECAEVRPSKNKPSSKSKKVKDEDASARMDLTSFAADAPKMNLASEAGCKKGKLAEYSAVNPEIAESGQQMADMKQYKHFKFDHLQENKIK